MKQACSQAGAPVAPAARPDTIHTRAIPPRPTGVVSSAGNLFYLLFKPAAAVLCCGLWLAWNCLFAGVLVKVRGGQGGGCR